MAAAGVNVNTLTKSFGQDATSGDDSRWPLLVLHLNPTLLRWSTEALLAAFEVALTAATTTVTTGLAVDADGSGGRVSRL